MQRSERHDLYAAQLAGAIPRALTALDRDPFSLTYGCFDREYWSWATKDFANFDLQRAIYPLTLAYLTEFPGNLWYRAPRLKDWIDAAFAHCERVQHGNGSFDHHYPNEFSFVGVAFPLAEIGLAFMMLDEAGALAAEERGRWLDFFARGAGFLCRVDETHGFISNHRLGAVCGLHIAAKLTGEARFKRRGEEILATVLSKASPEGWPLEYTGADPGYQTLDTNFMAHYFRLSGDQAFLERLVLPSLEFLIYFFHPDGSVGGEYGSRNCPLYYPGGFETFAPYSGAAETMARLGAKAIVEGGSANLHGHDIRNFVPMMSSYSLALTASGEARAAAEASPPPFERQFERYWPQAGLYVRSDASRYTVVGCSKGGVVKFFDKTSGGLAGAHSGYLLEAEDGACWSTQFHENNPVSGLDDCIGGEAELKPKRTLSIEARFFKVVPMRLFTPLRFLLFRIFVLTLGRNLAINNWVKRNIITGLVIHRRKPSNVRMRRQFTFTPESVEIRDELAGLERVRPRRLRAADIFTTIYMGSSKYYRSMEALPDDLSRRNLLSLVRAAGGALLYRLDATGLTLADNGKRDDA
jgi:hypothetical protein